MLDDFARVNLLSGERERIRAEIVAIGTDLRRTIFAFLTVGIAVTGTYLSNLVSIPEQQGPFVLFALSQVGIFLAAYGVSLASHQRVLTGYCAALELRINSIAEENLCAWELKVMPLYLHRTYGPFFLSFLVFMAFLVATFGILVWTAFRALHPLFAGLLVFEVVPVISLFIWSQGERQRVAKGVLDSVDGQQGDMDMRQGGLRQTLRAERRAAGDIPDEPTGCNE